MGGRLIVRQRLVLLALGIGILGVTFNNCNGGEFQSIDLSLTPILAPERTTVPIPLEDSLSTIFDLKTSMELSSSEVSLTAGQPFSYTLQIESEPQKADLGVFIHLVDASGKGFVALNDISTPSPVSKDWRGTYKFSGTMQIPESARGAYTLMAGVFQKPSATNVRMLMGPGVRETYSNDIYGYRYVVGTAWVVAQSSSVSEPLPPVQQFVNDRLLSHDAPLGMMPSGFGQKYRPNIFSNTRENNRSGGEDLDQSFRRMDCSWFVWWFTAFLEEGRSTKPNTRVLVDGGTMWALENGTGGGVNGRWIKIFEMTSFHSIGSGKVSPGSIYRDDYHSGLAGPIAPYVGDSDDWRYETGGSGKIPTGGNLNLQGTKSVRTLQAGYNYHGYFEPGGRKYVDRSKYKGYAFYARVKAIPHDPNKPLDNDGQTYVVGLGVDLWDASNTYIGLNGAPDGYHNGDMGTYRHTYVKNDWTWITAVSITAKDWLANPIPGLPR